MAIYTGILGTKNSQPGKFWLGAGPVSSNNTQSVVDGVTVADAIHKIRIHNEAVSDAITVTSTAETIRIVIESVTDTITVSPAITLIRVLQRSISDPVTVTSTVSAPGTDNVSVTDTATVAQTIHSIRDVVRSITDSVTVADDIEISGTAFLTQAVVEYFYAANPAAIITQAVTEYFFSPPRAARVVTQSVHDIVLISSAIKERNTVVRITVNEVIRASEPSRQKNQDFCEDRILVADEATAVSTGIHITITDLISVITVFPNPITFVITNVRLEVIDRVTVSDQAFGGAPDRLVSVIDTIVVTESTRRGVVNIVIADLITVTDVIAGGQPIHLVALSDSATVSDVATARSTRVRLNIRDNVRVLETRSSTVKTKFPVIAVTDTIRVTSLIRDNGPNYQTINDHATISELITPRVVNNRQFVTSSVTVNEHYHVSPVHQAVTDTVTVASRLTHFDLVVVSRVTVTDSFHRRYDETITDTLGFTETVTTTARVFRSASDHLPIIEALSRQMVWQRSLTDTIIIPSGLYQKSIDFAGTVINVPVAVGTLVSKTCTIQSKSGIITLPAPQLGDQLDNVAKTTIQRSMNGATIVFKQSTTRQRLKYQFRVDGIKAFELRTFLQANLSELLTLTTWSAQIWAVYLISSPFELQNAGRSGNSGHPTGPNEYSTIELEFEGVKLSG